MGDGVHHEFESCLECGWPRRLVHVAGVLGNSSAQLFLDGRPARTLALPSSAVEARSIFDGPLLVGRNPAWRDRGAVCRLAAARVTSAAIASTSFLPAPGTS